MAPLIFDSIRRDDGDTGRVSSASGVMKLQEPHSARDLPGTPTNRQGERPPRSIPLLKKKPGVAFCCMCAVPSQSSWQPPQAPVFGPTRIDSAGLNVPAVPSAGWAPAKERGANRISHWRIMDISVGSFGIVPGISVEMCTSGTVRSCPLSRPADRRQKGPLEAVMRARQRSSRSLRRSTR